MNAFAPAQSLERAFELGALPAYPETREYAARLQWAIAVAYRDDPDLGFLASLLSYVMKHGGLTDPQAKYAGPILDRLRRQVDAERAEHLHGTSLPFGETLQ